MAHSSLPSAPMINLAENEPTILELLTKSISSNPENRNKISFPTQGITFDEETDESLSSSREPTPLGSTGMSGSTGLSTPALDPLSASVESFWYSTTSPLLGRLFQAAKYPDQLRQSYLSFFRNLVVPAFGSIPSPSSTWIPHLTKDHSSFEPSWNLQGNKQQIRFTTEPVGLRAGTKEDPFNQLVPISFVEELSAANICPDLNTVWWKHFTSEFFLSDSENFELQSLSPPAKMTPTCFLAFDLPTENFAPILKPYLFPHRRALLSGKTTTQTTISSVKKLHSADISLLPALTVIESFLSGTHTPPSQPGNQVISNLGGEENHLSIEMLAIDCISPSKARIKLYVKENYASFANVKSIYTLGGQRTEPEIDHGIEAIEKFWACLFGDTDNEQHKPAFLFLGLEITPGVAMPEVKLYIPAWTCGFKDAEITDRLGNYFRSQNLAHGSTYEADFQGLCKEDAQSKISHTYLSFAYSSDRGPYVTMYYSSAVSSELGPL